MKGEKRKVYANIDGKKLGLEKEIAKSALNDMIANGIMIR
jgi:hypothetical protein